MEYKIGISKIKPFETTSGVEVWSLSPSCDSFILYNGELIVNAIFNWSIVSKVSRIWKSVR